MREDGGIAVAKALFGPPAPSPTFIHFTSLRSSHASPFSPQQIMPNKPHLWAYLSSMKDTPDVILIHIAQD